LIDTYEEEEADEWKGVTQTLKRYIKKQNNSIKDEIS